MQDTLVKVTSAISLMTDNLLQSRARMSKPNYQVWISRLIDPVALLGHANKELSFKRKETLRRHLRSDFKSACSRNFKPKDLFGNELAKMLQEIKATSHVLGNFWLRHLTTRNSSHYEIARGKCKSCILVVNIFDIFSIFDDAKVLQS